MNLVGNVLINIYSLVFVVIIYFRSIKDTNSSRQYKVFLDVLVVTVLILILDTVARFDGRPETIYPYLNYFGNFLLFVFVPVLPSLWLLYVNYEIFKENAKKLKIYLMAVNVVNFVLNLLSLEFGWFYYIDKNNIYHRGPYFGFNVLISVILLVYSYFLIIKYRRKIERKYYFSLAFSAVPPIISIFLGILFYGTTLVLNGVVISILFVFLDIQNQNIYNDYLTGIYNRKMLDIYLKEKISASKDGNTFSAILIDLNNFKVINDMYGHDAGDEALQITVRLIKDCLRQNDFIARYGGDEFCIILDIADMSELDRLAEKIRTNFEGFNNSKEKPYKINFGIGYQVYDSNSRMKPKDFLRLIDILMYKNKRKSKWSKNIL